MDGGVRTCFLEYLFFPVVFQAGHLMPMFNAKDKLKKGAIKPQDIPYMQRGGSWDNTDIKGGKLDYLHRSNIGVLGYWVITMLSNTNDSFLDPK
jgi:hypothetical protein